jgi:PKD repeat protein
VVTDDDGATDYALTSADIDASNQSPVAEAGGPYTGEFAVPVDFDGTGSDDPDGSIQSYLWDFGDGNTGMFPTTSHAYAAGGTYTVTLTVTDDDGATATDFSTAAIDSPNEPPVADANGPYVGVVDGPVSFDGSGSSDPDGNIAYMVWSFGDDDYGSGEAPSHTYAEGGVYDVILVVVDNEGAIDQVGTKAYIVPGNLPPVSDAGGPYVGTVDAPVTFDGTGSSDRDGTIVTYEWTWGDGSPAQVSEPTTDHVYSEAGIYNVSLEVTDDGDLTRLGAALTTIGELSVPPTADAGGPYYGTVGAGVTFDATASSDQDGTIVRYDWDFGDGETADDAGPTLTHAYTSSGYNVVWVLVTDDSGESNFDTATAIIGIGNLPPQADAGGPYNGSEGFEVTFDGTASFDPGGMITTYDWDFGDGTTATDVGPTVNHTYSEAGRYNVTLTVTDDEVAVDSDGAVVTVEATDRGGGGGGTCFITTAMGQ